MTETSVLAELALVSDVVQTAQATLATGHFVDMTGLDQAIADLCAATAALPQPHQHRAAQKLSRLALDLSALAEALTHQRITAERAAEAEARQRASGAYNPEQSAREHGSPGSLNPVGLDTYLRFLIALIFVVALIGFAAWAVRRFGLGARFTGNRGQRRLAVLEILPVDGKRRLLLLRRDQTEHLVLLGADGDLVIERGIGSAAEFNTILEKASA